jgi:hypothetical protein
MVSSICGSEGDIFLLFEGDRFLLREDARPLKWQSFNGMADRDPLNDAALTRAGSPIWGEPGSPNGEGSSLHNV